MKYTRLLVIAIILLSCTTPSPNTTVNVINSEDEQILRNLKTSLWSKAYNEQDTALLNRILHDDFQLIDDNGDTYSKKDEMEYVANYGPSYSSFEFEITRLDVFDNGTAMITGKGVMKGLDDQGAYVTTYTSSNTLIKVGEDWKAINSHVSGVKEERFENAPE